MRILKRFLWESLEISCEIFWESSKDSDEIMRWNWWECCEDSDENLTMILMRVLEAFICNFLGFVILHSFLTGFSIEFEIQILQFSFRLFYLGTKQLGVMLLFKFTYLCHEIFLKYEFNFFLNMNSNYETRYRGYWTKHPKWRPEYLNFISKHFIFWKSVI